MKASQHKAEVLAAFMKVSPSAIDIETQETYQIYSERQRDLFHYRLHFPPELFRHRSVIDFGCGTGEFDLVLAEWGANILGFDFNPDSITRANSLKSMMHTAGDASVQFLVGDIDTFAIPKSSYDIALSMGVLAHVPDQRTMFIRMANVINPGGYLILGFIEDSGLIQRLLHRAIVKALAPQDDAAISRIARRLFGEHIDRSVRHGNRTAESVINDYLVNPHYLGVAFQVIDGWAQDLGLNHYSSWPSTDIPFPVDTPDQPEVPRTADLYHTLLSLHRLRWMFAEQSDLTTYSRLLERFSPAASLIEQILEDLGATLQTADLDLTTLHDQRILWDNLREELGLALETTCSSVISELSQVSGELLKVLEYLTSATDRGSGDLVLPALEHLFKGYNGLGTSYAIWHKPLS